MKRKVSDIKINQRVPVVTWAWAFVFFSFAGLAQAPIRVDSPDHNLNYSFQISGGQITYSIKWRNKVVVEESPVSLAFSEFSFDGSSVTAGKPFYREGIEDYDLPVGKTSHVSDRWREVSIPLQWKGNPARRMNVVVRAFNDGIAFRYEFPKQEGWQNYVMTEETTTYKFPGDPVVLHLPLSNYTTSHEGLYASLPVSQIKPDVLMDLPVLVRGNSGIFIGLTEAALLDYAGTYLSSDGTKLFSKLSPLPKEAPVKVKATLPHKSPWRVLLISDRVGALMESNIITSLNEPQKIRDISWIKPGKTTWPWWNGTVTPDTTFAPGNNFETNKYYIDFCAKNKIAYHSIVEYGTEEWYVNDGVGLDPGPNADVTKPVQGLDMIKICDYAKSKGVDIRVWVHWAALFPRPKLDSAFAVFERWGVKGMMVDFMDRDDQEMVNNLTQVLEVAAKHHLHIQFHGAYKPTGLSRTYPNELTREGALNYEYDKWMKGGVTPDHDISMPFTRVLAGPTDYHLGGFRAATPENFRIQYTRPLVLGTRCHMLAMYVVLESYLSLVSDYPDAYHGQKGFEFIRDIPTTWDETRILDAKVGEYVVTARRKGRDWYIGAITNHASRTLNVPMTFLPDGTYTYKMYQDANDGDPNHLVMTSERVSYKDTLVLQLGEGGGAAIMLTRQ